MNPTSNMSSSTPLADMQTIVEIRRDVPLAYPRVSTVQEDSPADFLLRESKAARANRSAIKRANEAFAARVAVHNGPPNDVYEANRELQDAEDAMRAASSALLEELDAELPALLEADRKARVELVSRFVPMLDAMEIELAEIARRSRALASAKRGKSVGDPFFRDSTHERIPGGESLFNLRKGLEALLPSKPTVFVSPAAYAELQSGNDAEDLEGNAITFEEADELFRAKRLRVSHGQLLPRGASS